MRTIVIIGGIILAGATVVAVVQSGKNDRESEVIQQNGVPAGGTDSTTPMLNPAHGVTGHRCDLPVGAPLNTASGTISPGQTPQPVAPAPAGVKLNPAHGMPGHRCDLQVGAPLS